LKLKVDENLPDECADLLRGAGFPREERDHAQHDAYSVAAWMRHAADTNCLAPFFHPDLEKSDRKAAEIEGWMLGVA
jgi:hypothetical protein